MEKCSVKDIKECLKCENYRSMHTGTSRNIEAFNREVAWIDCSLGLIAEFFYDRHNKGRLVKVTNSK